MTPCAHVARPCPQPPAQEVDVDDTKAPDADEQESRQLARSLRQPLLLPRIAVVHARMHVPRSAGAAFVRQSSLHADSVVRAVWTQAFISRPHPPWQLWAAALPASKADRPRLNIAIVRIFMDVSSPICA
jgi:hypothetical protein